MVIGDTSVRQLLILELIGLTGWSYEMVSECLEELISHGLVEFSPDSVRVREMTQAVLDSFNAITIAQLETSEIYYSVPKVLLEDDKYKDLRLDAKMLYAVLKDRLKLSAKNGWVDDKGRVYLEYSNRQLQELFNCSKNTILTIRKNLVAHSLIYEESQFTRADGQVANRIYLGNVIAYDREKYQEQRRQRQKEIFQKKQESKLDFPSANLEPTPFEFCTGAVQNLHPNNTDTSKSFSSKIGSSRKSEKNSEEFSPSAGADNPSIVEKSETYIEPKYYSLLQVIADEYNGKFCQLDLFTGESQNYHLTHRQKMMIGQYLAEGYVTSREVINLIGRIAYDCQSPLAYLMQSLENLKEERRLEAKIHAHRQADLYYGRQAGG